MRADRDADTLRRVETVRLVPLGRTGRRQHRVRAVAERDVDVELVAARDAARRMHDHRVADRVAFRVQWPLHAQRAVV